MTANTPSADIVPTLIGQVKLPVLSQVPTISAKRISLAKAAIWSTPSLAALANYNMWDRPNEPYWNISRGITAT